MPRLTSNNPLYSPYQLATPNTQTSMRKKVRSIPRGPPQSLGSSNGPTLVCPYFARCPRKRTRHASCFHPGFTNISRLKEHLYRRHLLPPGQCPRCYVDFETEQRLQKHLRDRVRCEIRNPSSEGISPETEKLLKSKKRYLNETEEEKWKRVYRILFGNVDENDIPSPYCRHQEDLQAGSFGDYQAFVREHGSEVIHAKLQDLSEKVMLNEEQQNSVAALVCSLPEQLLEEYGTFHRSKAGMRPSSTSGFRDTLPPAVDESANEAPPADWACNSAEAGSTSFSSGTPLTDHGHRSGIPSFEWNSMQDLPNSSEFFPSHPDNLPLGDPFEQQYDLLPTADYGGDGGFQFPPMDFSF